MSSSPSTRWTLSTLAKRADEQIKADYTEFTGKLELPDIQFVPLSALNGDNVVNASEHTPWYHGGTLMHILENVHIASDRNLVDFRFPVQYVNRPDLNFRGFSGTIASGTVRPGDEVMALPSRKKAIVKRIVTMDGDLDEAYAPLAPTIVLDREIDVSRGDMLVQPNNVPKVAQAFEAMVVWMSEDPLTAGKQYTIKQTTTNATGVVSDLRYRMDVNTMHRQDADKLELNEIGRIVVELSRPMAFDPYTRNRGTGSFIVIDKLTNNTVGAGMILDRELDSASSRRREIAEKRGTEIKIHESLVGADERATRLGQQPVTVWLTGPDWQRQIGCGLRLGATPVRRRQERHRARWSQRTPGPQRRPETHPGRPQGKPASRIRSRQALQRCGPHHHLRFPLAQR